MRSHEKLYTPWSLNLWYVPLHSTEEIVKSLASVCPSALALTAKIFVQFGWNFAPSFGAQKERSGKNLIVASLILSRFYTPKCILKLRLLLETSGYSAHRTYSSSIRLDWKLYSTSISGTLVCCSSVNAVVCWLWYNVIPLPCRWSYKTYQTSFSELRKHTKNCWSRFSVLCSLSANAIVN